MDHGDAELLSWIESELAAVDVALARLDEGSYWTCEICGVPLDSYLLAAEPHARSCAGHAVPMELDLREPQELDLREPQELLDSQDPKGFLDLWEQQEFLDSQDPQEFLDLREPQELDVREPQELPDLV